MELLTIIPLYPLAIAWGDTDLKHWTIKVAFLVGQPAVLARVRALSAGDFDKAHGFSGEPLKEIALWKSPELIDEKINTNYTWRMQK